MNMYRSDFEYVLEHENRFMQTMKKSVPVDLSNFPMLSDDNFSDDDLSNDYFSDDDQNDSVIYSAPIEHFTQMFKLQDFKNTKRTHLPRFTDEDFDLQKLNTPLLTQPIPQVVPVDCAYLMCSQCDHFPQPDSEYFASKPTLFMWRNMNNVLPSDFSAFVQEYFHEKYIALKKPIRFFFQVAPTIDKLSNVSTIRRDIQGGRILFHYIGYGFNTIGEDIYALDKKSNKFIQYPLKNLFENLKPPAWFIFDCSNAAAALHALKRTQEQKNGNDKIDWSDWFCFCATNVNEKLPSDPHLPRDFLTSCLLTPTRTAVLCHILQYYRTTLVKDNFPLRDLDGRLLGIENQNKEPTPLHKSLQKTLDSITDAIAADVLPVETYKKLFRADPLTTKLFRNYLLAQYLLRPFQIHPVSVPSLPDLSVHPLWQQWRATVDMAVFCSVSPLPDFHTDLYKRSLATFRGFLKSGDLEKLPTHILMILFHLPDDKTLKSEGFKLLSQFAATSKEAREKLTNVAHFDPLIETLLSPLYDDDHETYHSLLYLVVVMLQAQPSLANLRQTYDVSPLEKSLFNENLHQDTRTLVAVIVATLIPNNDNMRRIAVSEEFILKLRTLLESCDSELALWCLIIERKMFDSFGLDLHCLYTNGLHIQTASFCLHYAHEVRAAALATLPCLLQTGQDTANMHLFGFAIICGFDGSYMVRYNFVHFLTRFLSIYSDKIAGHVPIGLLSHQPYESLIATWIGNDATDILTSKQSFFSDFERIHSFITQIMRSQDALQKFVGIGLFMAEYLNDDPHPSVQQLAHTLQVSNVKLSGIKHKLNKMKNLMSVPVMNADLSPMAGSLPTPLDESETSDEESQKFSKPASNDSGGDALFKSCISQIVRSGAWKPISHVNSSSRITALPPAPVGILPSIQVHCKLRGNLAKKPTDIAYDKNSRDVAISFDDGTVSYLHEDGKTSSIKFSSKVTSLQVTQYDSSPFTLIGTDDGCCHIWDCVSQHPTGTFRTDGVPQCHSAQFISPINNEHYILTARGNCGTVRLYDVNSQKLVHEWLPTQNNKDNIISALTVDPVTGASVVGFSTGLVVVLDTMAETLERTGNPNMADVDKIIDLKATLSPSKTFYAATENGKLLSWSDFSMISGFIAFEREKITSFDVHTYSPLICITTERSNPAIISCDRKLLYTLKEPGPGAIIRFHPSLPVIGVVSENGSLYEYDISDVQSNT